MLHFYAPHTAFLWAYCLLQRFGCTFRQVHFGWGAFWVAAFQVNQTVSCAEKQFPFTLHFAFRLWLGFWHKTLLKAFSTINWYVCVWLPLTFAVACDSLFQLATHTQITIDVFFDSLFVKLCLCSLLFGAKQITLKALSGEQNWIYLNDT